MKLNTLVLVLIFSALSAFGQEPPAVPLTDSVGQNDAGKLQWVESSGNEYSIWAGHSFYSSNWVWGKTSDASLNVLGFRYSRPLLLFFENHQIEYTADASIVANYTFSEFTDETNLRSIRGFGLAPAGFQLNFYKDSRLQPFFKSSGGFLYLDSQFPDERGTRFHFNLELGIGLEWFVMNNASLSFGYKYHHISNGSFGEVNPGIDSNIFYGGITLF